jgi:hypothetical protein
MLVQQWSIAVHGREGYGGIITWVGLFSLLLGSQVLSVVFGRIIGIIIDVIGLIELTELPFVWY